MKQITDQERHELLVDFLNQFAQYQSEGGKPRLKKVKRALASNEYQSLDTNDINMAVVAFTDVLNLSGGSASDVNLYKLLQAYLQHPQLRGRMDSIALEAHSL